MRYFAVTLLLAAMGAAGYLAWTGLHQTPEVIPSGEVKTVRVDNFAYASPELVKPENLKVEAPAVRDEAVQAAELWSKKFALDNGLTNVRVTRYNHVAGSRVVLVFNGIADQQVKALLKRSKAEGIGLSVCPKGL